MAFWAVCVAEALARANATKAQTIMKTNTANIALQLSFCFFSLAGQEILFSLQFVVSPAAKMSLLSWLSKAKTAKTPLVPKPTDKVEEAAVREIDNAVATHVPQAVGKRRGSYHMYDDQLRQKMVRFAVMNGQAKAARHFTKELGHDVRQSTIGSMVKAYKKSCAAGTEENFAEGKGGRPTLLLRNQSTRGYKPLSGALVELEAW